MKNRWSDEQIQYVISERESGKTFIEISQSFNKKYKEACTDLSIKKTYYRYRDADMESADVIKSLKAAHRASKAKGQILKENKALVEASIGKEEFLQSFKELLESQPIRVHKALKNKNKPKKFKRTIVAHLSDTHFQANIDEEEMGGLNKYGSIEEARRLAFFFREVANYKLHYRDTTDLVVVLNGDLGQGIIHNQECTPLITTQMSAMMHLLTQGLSYLAQQFKQVQVICLTDNHLRVMHKENKGRATAQKWDSFSTMLHVALRYALKSHTNVAFTIPATPYAYFDIQGHKFFATHSDTVISSGNVGTTISSKAIKDKVNDLISGLGPIDVVMCGHAHVSTYQTLNNNTELLINGTMSGIDPFAQSLGILKNNPSQQLIEVTEDYAVGDVRFVRLVQADKLEELDEIIQPFSGKF